MKKTLSVLVMAAIILSVFSCIPVNAATNANMYLTKTAFKSVGGISVYIVAQAFYPASQPIDINNPSVQGSTVSTWQLLLTYSVSNVTTGPLQVTNPRFTIAFNSLSDTPGVNNPPNYYAVVGLQNFAEDVMIGKDTTDTNQFTLYPGTNWTHFGTFCIPAGVRVNGVSVLEFPATYHNTEYIYAVLDSMTIYLDTPYGTDYIPVGSTKNITNAINDAASTLHIDLQNLITIMGSNNQINSGISNDSGTLKTQSDSVHSQEASYYQQNSAAIQATGLSNYQFDASAVSGLTGVRGDFLDIWNSLGSWNSVYIFSLTLGLALTILRHAPSAVSSAMRRRKDKQ